MQLAAGESGEPIDVWLMFAAAEREKHANIDSPAIITSPIQSKRAH